ncbi:uncharacterized protein RSE6_03662 [Rhynchosporium secalis]|uniref:Uncharacterized protein n=1 Tax=Rhynchosporium secalis TaxID=38038 RepID=A0A1E1M3B6_RHYSE|nr:uncharacterized protein RSE6_03662 [Rhynchosporium secalis]
MSIFTFFLSISSSLRSITDVHSHSTSLQSTSTFVFTHHPADTSQTPPKSISSSPPSLSLLLLLPKTASPITAPVTEGNYMEKRICGTLSGKAPEICQTGKLANFA